ncbi:lipopolysaccharide assembly protein LapA domain-containing protein [Microbulbifer sp. OS29]|uniref:Lipopolysaccharide assembly protein LapA domain-containing protein n=1 Tax=Microbulbifer okhotskensis TaxID=2926617 RepID=A0A9X2EM44_9GAMM|nr:lipopolysaccharide assembly protein LapA domain-containing protein [Microbulbifer okhotskensis]MCO1334105.1 lipopolysaccharide assembly protein LapA domain-containing protein [Microbulbifer okhotskensis]
MSFLRWLIRIVYGVLALLCIALGIYFAVANPETITPNIVGYQLPAGSVGFWLVGFLLLGLLAGFAVSLQPIYAERRRARVLEKQLKKVERELQTAHRKVSGD